jgi:hypothetical protein
MKTPGGVMPENGPPEKTETRYAGQLNDAQQRRLSVTCKYIDNLLCEIELALHIATSESPFPVYLLDVTPVQAREIEDHIRRLRLQLLRVLAWQHLKPEAPEIPVTRSITTDLAFVDIAIEELKPRYMRGCGPVPADAVDELNHAIHELRSAVKEMEDYVRRVMDENPEPEAKA